MVNNKNKRTFRKPHFSPVPSKIIYYRRYPGPLTIKPLFMTSPQINFILIACFGALCQEIMHWFELRNKLQEDETKKLFTSMYYWLITIITIIISGIGTMILFYEGPPDTPLKNRIPFILGAAFPLIFKKLIDATQKRDLGEVALNAKPTFSEIAKKYFQ